MHMYIHLYIYTYLNYMEINVYSHYLKIFTMFLLFLGLEVGTQDE